LARTWINDSRYDTFDEADARRKALLDESTGGLLVKVKHMSSDDRFVVKTYLDSTKTVPKKDAKTKKTDTKGRLKTRAQRRSDRERRRRERLKLV